MRKFMPACAPASTDSAPMTNALLYLTTVLIWGTTWIALKLQLGPVPIAWSIVYRFGLAAAVLMAWLALRRQWRLPERSLWPLLLAQGLALFCLNFVCFLNASRWIASGLVAVCFSTAPLWNALNGRWFQRRALSRPVLLGGALGLAGLLLLFGTEALKDLQRPQTLWGLALALAGTCCFSLGNLLSGALQRRSQTPLQTNAWAMAVGACATAAWALAQGERPAFDASPSYVGAWLYLAIPGSVIGFTAYLTLVGRLGADKAAYCTVLFPVVALNVSAWLEGYAWGASGVLGLGLVLAGNVVVFWRGGRPRAMALKPR
jgi:drug/metabolite transporter (DMT)-like permease